MQEFCSLNQNIAYHQIKSGRLIDIIIFDAYTPCVKLPVLTFETERDQICANTNHRIIETKGIYFDKRGFKPAFIETYLKREFDFASNFKEKKAAVVKYLKDGSFTTYEHVQKSMNTFNEKINAIKIE